MRISSQSMDTSVKPIMSQASSQTVIETSKSSTNLAAGAIPKVTVEKSPQENTASKQQEISVEKLTEAVDAVNEFLKLEKRSSQFILHEGLDKYYVRLVDPETEEIVKEIPPERLLDAFYEMQKLAGMIVDEKI